jgi:hypothetical protein
VVGLHRPVTRRGNRVSQKAIGTDRPQLRVADAEWISDPVSLYNLKFVGRTRRLRFTNFKLTRQRDDRRNELDPVPGSTIA